MLTQEEHAARLVRLNQLILDKGVMQKHVAKMTGMNYHTLSKILKGYEKYQSAGSLDKIETYLNRINTDDPNLLD